jgi:hypothetical protein
LYSLRAQEAFNASPLVHFVRIASSRSRIEPREPTVGFTIVTDRPFAEVFVAASPELFLPEHAASRRPSTWFASRAHGLLQGPGEIAYLLPAAFVASAVKAEPRATRLYYLAAAYSDAEGTDPLWSIPQDQWAQSLPFVEVARDLQAPAIASTLGVALDRLTRTIGWHDDLRSTPAMATAFGSAFGAVLDAAPAAGERILWRHETTGTIGPAQAVRGLDARGETVPDERTGGETVAAPGDEAVRETPSEGGEGDPGDAAIPYDDGHGPADAQAHGLDSSYPAGAEEPDDLPDDESGGYGDEASWQAAADGGEAVVPADGTVGRVLDGVLAELGRTKNGSLYELARATPGDGLAFGILQATQRSGELGRVLEWLRSSDAATFDRMFGGPEAARELLLATKGESETARMQPVCGKPLTDVDWQARFAQVGRYGAFIAAQQEYAKRRMLEPLLPIARDLGLASAKGLAMLACVLVAKGLEAGMTWILAGICPVSTPPQIASAMSTLGHATLSAFQEIEGLRPSGELDVATQARITRKLRELGARSPVPVLAPSQMLETIVRQASGESFRAKLESLAESSLDTRDLPSDKAVGTRSQPR